MAQTRSEWLAQRRKGIGSSDAAAICGLSPWKTAYEVWLDKTGQLPADLPPSELQRWGLRLEDAIAEAYTERTGEPLTKPELRAHAEYPWMLATCDRLRADGRVVELKCANAFTAGGWGPEGTDQVPTIYLIQVQHQLAVVGAEGGEIAALIGGNDFRIYPMPRHAELIETMTRLEAEFWACVQNGTPPPIDWEHSTTLSLVKAMNPATGGRVVVGDPSLVEDLDAYEEFKKKEAQAKRHKEACQAKLIASLGTAAEAVLADGTVIRRPLIRVGAYDVKAHSYYGFNIKRPKRSLALAAATNESET